MERGEDVVVGPRGQPWRLDAHPIPGDDSETQTSGRTLGPASARSMEGIRIWDPVAGFRPRNDPRGVRLSKSVVTKV